MTLESLPTELFLNITANLTADELTKLTCTCKRINALVHPLLWTNIDLYHGGYRDTSRELKVPQPFISPSPWVNHTEENASDLFRVLEVDKPKGADRPKELMAQVKSLCTVVEDSSSTCVWSLLPHFTNLEALQLHGQCWHDLIDEESIPEISAPPIPKLRFAKLSAYIPRTVAKWVIFRCGMTLERLELGLLDRPISDERCGDPKFPPLPRDAVDDSDASDEESDYGSVTGMRVIPRPLGGFLPAKNDPGSEAQSCDSEETFELLLPRLKHLHLSRPSEKINPGSRASYNPIDYSWSSRADEASLADWRRILQASSNTLEVLVLEQRPGAVEIEADSVNSPEYMRSDEAGLGSKLLIDMLEELLEQEDGFRALRCVYLYGIPVGKSHGKPSEHVPGGRLMRLLERRNVTCEARLGSWCYFDDYTGEARWEREIDNEDEGEDEEDRGDVGGHPMKWDSLLASV
ncbi:hypothetical protein G7Z17_g2670 [Cylindrodendrum hubeiense]|uniref:F-box domain-containing protein n=1 Tax=Cylindrodendrum hubeiense TaxID=595255 RepID=A0A9P5HH72_9HYPO|nr:hypothetical protein G7Z17_g2670 [Cylindrodendrum hubeiense]